MTDAIQPTTAYINDTGTEKGRGVFADRDYQKGERVESAPVIVLTRPFRSLPPRLKTIVYNWGALTNGEPSSAVALGFGSMYNHNNPANMRYEANIANDTLNYITVQDIAEGEELTVNYNNTEGAPESKNDDWFQRNNINPLSN